MDADSAQALATLQPLFFNDLKFIKNPVIEKNIMDGIAKCVDLGCQKFNMSFGGWYPESNEFGIATLRPANLDVVGASSSRWYWTSGASVSCGWSNTDTWIDAFNLGDDEIMLVYGYFNLNPVQNIVEMQIKPGNVTLPIWNVQPMRMKNEPYFFLPVPIVVNPRSPFQVDASCISISTTEEAGLLGYFFAPCATLITK